MSLFLVEIEVSLKIKNRLQKLLLIYGAVEVLTKLGNDERGLLLLKYRFSLDFKVARKTLLFIEVQLY